MTDDLLGLGSEPEPESRRQPRPDPPSYLRRRLALGAVVLAVLAIIGFGVAGGAKFLKDLVAGPADYSGSGSGSTVVEIKPGDSLSQIGQRLLDAEVVRSVGAFTDAASGNPDATSIGPGFYRLHEHMEASLAVELLLDPDARVRSLVTIPEGRRLRDILTTVADHTDISLDELKAAASSPDKLGVPSWGQGHSLEGFLFPATYDFGPGTTATEALQAMVSRFNQAASDVGLVAGAKQLHRTPYEVLTLASIIEREGRLTEDFAQIAEVFYNRLERGMNLGSDATLFYVLPPDHGGLTNADLQLDSPYNTRLNPGLPPTPIASPGQAALEAALHPAHGSYLYFVTIDQEGHAAFATTLDEFNQLVAQSRANGVQ